MKKGRQAVSQRTAGLNKLWQSNCKPSKSRANWQLRGIQVGCQGGEGRSGNGDRVMRSIKSQMSKNIMKSLFCSARLVQPARGAHSLGESDDEEVDCGLCCLAFIYAGLGFALGFFFALLAAYRVAYNSHTHTHRRTVLQQSVSISFHLYTFLFALATCFHTSPCLPHSLLLPSPSSTSFSLHSFPYYLTLLPLPILYIFFFLLLAPFTLLLLSLCCCVCVCLCFILIFSA